MLAQDNSYENLNGTSLAGLEKHGSQLERSPGKMVVVKTAVYIRASVYDMNFQSVINFGSLLNFSLYFSEKHHPVSLNLVILRIVYFVIV